MIHTHSHLSLCLYIQKKNAFLAMDSANLYNTSCFDWVVSLL